MKRIFDVQPWHVTTTNWNPADKRLQESMTSLGNGNLGMRGFFEENYSGDTLAGIYLGGVWFPDKTRVGWWKNGYPKYFGKVINAVNFMATDIKINGESVDLAKDKISNFKLDLDMQQSVLTRTVTVHKQDATVRLVFERFISAAQKELVVQRIKVKNIGKTTVNIEVAATVDANVVNEDANYDETFWNVLTTNAVKQQAKVVAITKENDFGTPRFTVGTLATTKTELKPVGNEQTDTKAINNFGGQLAPNEQTVVEKRTVIVTSRDYSEQSELEQRMVELGNAISQQTYAELFEAHRDVWAKRWEKSDVKITGDDAAQQGIRFNLFQLFSTYYGEDSRLNIGPKGFTGEKYGGATYWDTEAFAVPVYLGITDPSVTRNLLMYRYQQLDGAFHNAREQGLKGALYPMVTFDGIESHNEWEITFEEIHRNGDIAFAIYNYTRYTGDESYVLNEGSRVLTEMSRFWADRVHFSKRNGKYMIHGVTGPDEYENNVDNNWYTNYLAKWTLKYTLEIVAQVTPEVAKKITGDKRGKTTVARYC